MEYVAICALAVVVALRGFRAERRTYFLCAGAAAIAALYTYHAV